jgi:hypothetical protein
MGTGPAILVGDALSCAPVPETPAPRLLTLMTFATQKAMAVAAIDETTGVIIIVTSGIVAFTVAASFGQITRSFVFAAAPMAPIIRPTITCIIIFVIAAPIIIALVLFLARIPSRTASTREVLAPVASLASIPGHIPSC